MQADLTFDNAEGFDNALIPLESWHPAHEDCGLDSNPSPMDLVEIMESSPEGDQCSSAGSSTLFQPAQATSASLPSTPPLLLQPVRCARSTTRRRKDKIHSLREQVTQLETRAEFLRMLSPSTDLTSNSNPPHDSTVCNSAPFLSRSGSVAKTRPDSGKRVAFSTVWKDLALRQKRLRAASEAENESLRQFVDQQRKTISGICRLLQRQTLQNDLHPIPLAPVSPKRKPISADDLRTLEHLRRDVESKEFISAIRSSQVNEAETVSPTLRARKVSATKLAISFFESRVMPFHFKDVADVIASSSVKRSLQHGAFIEQRTAERQGTYLHSYIAEYRSDGGVFRMCGDSAMRQYEDSKQTEIMFSGISRLLELQGAPVSGITMREFGKTTFSSVPGSDDEDFSLFQATLEVEIEMDAVSSKQEPLLNTLVTTLARKIPEYFSEALLTTESALLRH